MESNLASVLDGLTDAELTQLKYDWKFWARPKQIAPPGDWATWVIRAGRGFGKTRAGAGWVHARAMAQPLRWIALVARTPADARDYMIEGPGGLLRNTSPKERPLYESSKRRLTWPNGAWATVYSDEEPDQSRGFSGDTAWIDELAKFRNPVETWNNLAFGMREVSLDRPRKLITTTPRPIAILREIESLSSTIVVVGSSHENKTNLDQSWYTDLLRYEGTRIGRQEINAEIIDDLPGALWTRALLEQCRVRQDKLPEMKRVVVGVDPSGTSGADKNNQVGIVCVGLGMDGLAYVLADNTCQLSPDGWGRRVIATSTKYEADKIVAEKNFGGAMVDHVIRTVDKTANIKLVTASRGKVARAEPVSALYEQGKVKHVGAFPELEDQMCSFTSEGYGDEGSPDRVDALVWALTELMLQKIWQTDLYSGLGLPIAR